MESLFDLLDREWEGLGADRRAAARLPEILEIAGGASCLEGVRQWTRAADPGSADRVLLALAARSVEGDQLAGRVLLQLLLPGVRSLARRWWALGTVREREAAAVAAVFDRIRSYPIVRRPGKVAANILLDAGALLRRQVHDSRALVSLELVGDAPRTAPLTHPALELAEVLREAVSDGIISDDDASLIAASRIADIAHERGFALRTVQKHRHAAETALATAGIAA